MVEVHRFRVSEPATREQVEVWEGDSSLSHMERMLIHRIRADEDLLREALPQIEQWADCLNYKDGSEPGLDALIATIQERLGEEDA